MNVNPDGVVLGLLQNQWVRNPARVKEILARHPAAYRRKYLAALLFFGSLTGRRLKAAFGAWCNRIVWENASPTIAAFSQASPELDLAHVRQTVAEVKPHVVLAFGRRAGWALDQIAWKGAIIRGPHPAARMANVEDQLATMCRALEAYDEDQS